MGTSQASNFHIQTDKTIMRTFTLLGCSIWFTATFAVPWARIKDKNILQFEHIKDGVSLGDNKVAGEVMALNRLESTPRVMSRLEHCGQMLFICIGYIRPGSKML